MSYLNYLFLTKIGTFWGGGIFLATVTVNRINVFLRMTVKETQRQMIINNTYRGNDWEEKFRYLLKPVDRIILNDFPEAL